MILGQSQLQISQWVNYDLYYGCKLIISYLVILLDREPSANESTEFQRKWAAVLHACRLLLQTGRHNYNVITSSDSLGLTSVRAQSDFAGQKHVCYIQLWRPVVPALPWSYFSGGCNAGTRCALACCRCTCTSVRRGPSWRCRNYRPNVSSRLSASRSSRSPPPSFVHLRPPQRSRIAIRKVSEARAISLDYGHFASTHFTAVTFDRFSLSRASIIPRLDEREGGGPLN